MKILLNLYRLTLNFIYFFLKLLPTENRICFFSRQSNVLTTDFRMIIDEINSRGTEVEIKVICNLFRNMKDGAWRFLLNTFISMYFLATSKVCIIDAYWPTVSMLKHKDTLTVIQIWHSIGKIKMSGYQTLNKKHGRNADTARILCMHKNYDYIIAGGEAWNKYYCEAFNVDEDRLLNYGLPRLDYILERNKMENVLLEKYPEVQGKIIVLYAPTYRKYSMDNALKLKEYFDPERYAFICKLHPNQQVGEKNQEMISAFSKEDTFTLLQSCDYFITDYSSLALEAAAIDKKTFYYLFDYETYTKNNGLNIDLMKEMPKCSFINGKELFNAIDGKEYPQEELEVFKEKFLPAELGKSTEKIVDLVMENLN